MSIDLLSNTSHVECPVIIVTIGNYTFGTYSKSKNGACQYPNYIQSLKVTKINGQVNQYSLSIAYTVTEADDPNFFEKVFSSVAQSRTITFTYGDSTLPNYMYKEEKAIIKNITTFFKFPQIEYNISAISQCSLSNVGIFSFEEKKNFKPSNRIKWLLKQSEYGLLNIFSGMRDETLVNSTLIPKDDIARDLDAKMCSPLEYLQYLVNMMSPDNKNTLQKSSLYVLTFHDDTSGMFSGPYFKITETDNRKEHSEAYELNIGCSDSNPVLDLSIDQNENYSIFYEYATKLSPNAYIQRLNSRGEYETVYAPILSCSNNDRIATEADKNWWSSVTQYPVKCSVKIKGLLRPAILMSYLRINNYFYGKKHISSGLYIVTKQVDEVSMSGFSTTLNLIRVGGDSDYNDINFSDSTKYKNNFEMSL